MIDLPPGREPTEEGVGDEATDSDVDSDGRTTVVVEIGPDGEVIFNREPADQRAGPGREPVDEQREREDLSSAQPIGE